MSGRTRVTMENRIDHLRERRALRDMIVTEQQTMEQLMHALHTMTSERSIKPDSPHVSEVFTEWAESVDEVCERIQETRENLEEYSDRLEEVNEMLTEHTDTVSQRYD